MPEEILLSLDHWQQMRRHVHDCLPEEACGLIAGKENRSVLVFQVENELHSPVYFRMKPQEQIKSFLEMERKGLDLIAIYHSHPTGPYYPSETDRNEFAYPGSVYLIWSFLGSNWNARGFQMKDHQFNEISLQVL